MRARGAAVKPALVLALLLGSVVLGGGPTPGALAAPDGNPSTPVTYAGPPYTSQVARPPTSTSNQSKLWFHAGAWWALLLEPAGRTLRVFELMPDHTWRPTSGVVTGDAGDYGDALLDGDTTHVAFRPSDGSLVYVRLTFDPAARDYRPAPAVLVSTRGPRAPASLAKDSRGRLWVSFGTAEELIVTYTDDGLVWSPFNALGEIGAAATPESAALVAYDDRIGVLWADQWTGTFEFASHLDGDVPTTWTREAAGTGPPGGDPLSLRRIDGDPSDTLVASVTTTGGALGESPEAPRIQVLVRAPGGAWSAVVVSTVADGLSNPVLQVDAATRTLHVFAAAGDDVVAKQASLDDIRFDPGLGRLFMMGATGRFVEPAVTRDPVDARTGLVVLASDTGNLTYGHAEAAIPSSAPPPADPGDVTPPEPPALVQGRADASGTVTLTWSEVADPSRWAAARSGVPAAGYVVLRDGVEVGTVTTTSTVDEPGPSAGTVEYQVLAVDAAGNRSAPAAVVVDLAAEGPARPESSLGMWLLGLAGLAGALALYRPLSHAVMNSGRMDGVLRRVRQ